MTAHPLYRNETTNFRNSIFTSAWIDVSFIPDKLHAYES